MCRSVIMCKEEAYAETYTNFFLLKKEFLIELP